MTQPLCRPNRLPLLPKLERPIARTLDSCRDRGFGTVVHREHGLRHVENQPAFRIQLSSWDPILNSQEPVLFLRRRPDSVHNHFSTRCRELPEQLVTLKDNLTAVVIDDLSTIVKIAGVLQSKGTHYSLRGESATNLMDLRNGSSVIVGAAFDNAWTLRLTKTSSLSLLQ